MLVVCSVIFMACSKSEGDGITPTYKGEAGTTGNNPYNTTGTT